MQYLQTKSIARLLFLLLSFGTATHYSEEQKQSNSAAPEIPKTWDAAAVGTLEVPLAESSASPMPVSQDFYYAIPVRPIYKSYPKYHPDKEPPGYRDWLRQQEPVVLWDDGAHRPKLVTEEDWIRAGEIVFNAPILFSRQTDTAEEMRTFIAKTGELEVGEVSCAECHSRVMPDSTVIRGAQGNRPVEQVAYLGLAEDAANAQDKQKFLAEIRRGQLGAFAAPWLRLIQTLNLGSPRRRRSKRFISRFPPAFSPVRAQAPYRQPRFPISLALRNGAT
jgi:hypothetical protein